MSKRKPRQPGPPLWYKVDPEDDRQLILKNGTRIRRSRDDVRVYCSQGGKFYSLSRYGLREVHVRIDAKNNYCKPIQRGTGCAQGQHYPHVQIDNKSFPAHHMMIWAWRGIWDKLIENVDHIDGNIRNWKLSNLRVVFIEINDWCGGIIKRLRNAAKKHKLPMMDPSKRTPEDMLALYDRFEGCNLDEAMSEEIERQKVLAKLRESAIALHDPSLDPKNIDPKRLEKIFASITVGDPKDIMEYEMTHHMEC